MEGDDVMDDGDDDGGMWRWGDDEDEKIRMRLR